LGTSGLNNCAYVTSSATFDTTLYDTPYFLQFYSANNLGNNTTANYSSLGANHPTSKNIITVGSIGDMIRDGAGNFDYAASSGGVLSDYSSRGPTLDGRIKPDFAVNGHLVRSTSGTSSFESMSGTSMATANAAGTATLVIDYITRAFPGHFFRSSTVKAILVTTATGLGNPGPDYHYGWGAMNAKAACDLVKGYADNPSTRTIVEDELSSAQTWSRIYNHPGAGAVRVTLAWIDPAGASQASTSTDRTPRLVNDLNVRLISSTGTVYQPWVMPYTTGNGTLPAFDAGLLSANAVTGNNDRDNLEQVFVQNLPAGNYTVQVTHAGSLKGDAPQPFSLVFARLSATSAAPPVVSSVAFPSASAAVNSLSITAQGSGFVLGANMYLRRTTATGTQQTVQGYGVIPAGNRITARFDAASLTPGYWDIVVVNPGNVESVLPNGYLIHLPGGVPRRFDLYTNNFENGWSDLNFDPTAPGWAVGAPNKGAVGGPTTAQQGSRALVTHPGGNYPGNVYSSVYLPNISTVGYTDIRLEFQRWLGVANGDQARIRFFVDGGFGNDIFNNANVFDPNWGLQTYNLSSVAAGVNSLSIELILFSDGATHSFGWNIDDIKLTGVASYALPPRISSQNFALAAQNIPYSISVTATDEDTASSSLSFTATGLPQGLAMAANGTISGTPTTVGTTSFTVSVTDGIYTSSSNFSISVTTAIAKWRLDNGLPADGTGNGGLMVDLDRDGLVNLLEYAFGSNPNTTTGVLSFILGGSVTRTGIPVALNVSGSEGNYDAVFLRRKNPAAAGLTYTVQFSADLHEWVSSTTEPTVLTGSGASNPSDAEAVSVPFPSLITVPSGQKKPTYFRVVIVQQ
jgi:hypothetical protein